MLSKKDLWKMFEQTGDIGVYNAYKARKQEEDGE
jgi:hypothetical protein